MLSRITSLRGNEPWPGYDELTAAEVQAVLSEGDDDRARQVRSYERAHKNRAGVVKRRRARAQQRLTRVRVRRRPSARWAFAGRGCGRRRR